MDFFGKGIFMKVKNLQKIAALGGTIYESCFLLMKCIKCGNIALYDDENAYLYLDPHDLSHCRPLYGLTTLPPVLCPSCKGVDSFEEAKDDDLDNVMKSEWAFVLDDDNMAF